MSTDRELLEMAAKAAGIKGAYLWTPDYCGIEINDGRIWNSRDDDGDALRLLRAVDYGLLVEDGVVKIMNNLGGCVFFADINGADEMSVIRRAITSVAAAKSWSEP
ncbi:hypothetical protein [Herbaspirillum sp. CAH-3]|uniref:hypothetical protein n=1 Tax=Herbaspirillum sp. CAH-3 TaxID=2605746 RepID=UPI0012ACABEF|nr:hypothetical protein [Herbaspirillum sp. CAH-3]MRT30832.1 hypothetical protein [Herbaspirillum sp. CAH-3]